MDFRTILKRALGVATFNDKLTMKLASDKEAYKPALVFIGLAALAAAFGPVLFPTSYGGYVIFRPDVWTAIWVAASNFAFDVLAILLIGYLANTLFDSKLKPKALLGVFGSAYIIGLLAIIPQLSVVAFLWIAVVGVYIFKKIGKLDWGQLVLLIVLVAVLLFFLMWLLNLLGIAPPVMDFGF